MAHDKGVASTDGDNVSNEYAYKKDFRTALPQMLAVSAKNLLLLGYGMTLGFSTILIPAVQSPGNDEMLHLNKSEISWISSINLIVVPIGCALSGVVTSPIGRRRAMQMVNVPFFIAWLIFHFASSTGQLYGALFLTGLAGGLLEAPVLTYVAEITQPHLRGALTATSSLCVILGVFTQFLFGLLLSWREVALVNIIFTILAVIALCFVPESPHWLVSKKRHDDARKIDMVTGWLNSSRGLGQCGEVIDRMASTSVIIITNGLLNASEDEDESLREKVSHYLKGSFLKPFFLVSIAFFVGHFSGMTTLQTYAVSIFQMLEAPIDKYYATLILGVLQIVGSGACVVLVHYTGKRPLTIFSTAGAGVCCVLVASYDIYIKTNNVMESPLTYVVDNASSLMLNSSSQNITNEVLHYHSYSWMPTTLLMLLALVTHTGIRLLPWILIGEVFSAKTRTGGAGIAGAVGYIFGFLTNKMYISMVDSMSIWGTYSLYGVVSIVGCIVLYFILPETEGKKLNDIENHFAGVRRLNNEIYRSKKKIRCDVSKMQELKGTTNPTFEGDHSKL